MTNYAFQSLFDFTRTTSGTFVGSNGLIQTTPASVNLLTFTQELDNAAWTKSNSTVTANATVAPDGTSTADKLVEAATTSSHYVLQARTVTATTHVFSVYAKAGERSFVSLGFDGLNVWFNLTTGAVGTIEAGLTAAIVSVGDGWYRCSAIRTVTVAGSKSSVIYSASADNALSYTGNGTSGIFIWGAQLEQAATATTYTRNNGGVYPARFDYDPATLAPKGILIEEQRTNLVTYSEQFDAANWSKSGSTVTADATTSPDGTVNADKLVEAATTAQHRIAQTRTITSGAAYTYSIYAKAAERTSIWVRLTAASTFTSCIVDLTNGAISTPTGTCTATNVGNGWYRITVSGTSDSTTVTAYTNLIDGAGANTYTGDGTSGVYIYGAQLEAGAFATSYIPTVASQVTRAPDQTSIVAPNFAPWYNQSEGTFVVEADRIGYTNSDVLFTTTDGGTANLLQQISISSTSLQLTVRVGGVNQAALTTTVSASAVYKMASAYKLDDFATVADGGAVLTDTSGTIPTVDRLGIGSRAGTIVYNGHIRSIRYYPTRLSNSQLQALTA